VQWLYSALQTWAVFKLETHFSRAVRGVLHEKLAFHDILADILAMSDVSPRIIARMSVSVSVSASWNSSLSALLLSGVLTFRVSTLVVILRSRCQRSLRLHTFGLHLWKHSSWPRSYHMIVDAANIRSLDKLSTFKRQLKSHLFQSAAFVV